MATETEKCLWAARPLMESAPVPQKRRLEMNYRQQENELKNNHKKNGENNNNKKKSSTTQTPVVVELWSLWRQENVPIIKRR